MLLSSTMRWQTFTGVQQSDCYGFYCSAVAQKEVMQRWMLIKCFLALICLNEWRHMHSVLEHHFRFYFAAMWDDWQSLSDSTPLLARALRHTHIYWLLKSAACAWRPMLGGWMREEVYAHMNTRICGMEGLCNYKVEASVSCRHENVSALIKWKVIPPTRCCLALFGTWEERQVE